MSPDTMEDWTLTAVSGETTYHVRNKLPRSHGTMVVGQYGHPISSS